MRTQRLVVAVVLAASSASAQTAVTGALDPPRSPRNANYSIDARLEPETRTITASETIAWRNITTNPIDELQFHLYWNAWKDRRSTFMREEALRGAADRERPEGDWSSLRITAVRLMAGGTRIDLAGRQRFVAPDDGNTDDQTVLAVSLPQQVAPGGAVTLQIDWTAHVPRTFARTGAIGNYFFIAQWFPKLGVLQDEGWNCHQFHASTEFFSDYGIYDVRLTVPKDWLVGATEFSAIDRRTPTARPRIGITRRTCTISRGRRAPSISSGRRNSSMRRSPVSRCGCSCSRNTRGRPIGTSTPRGQR